MDAATVNRVVNSDKTVTFTYTVDMEEIRPMIELNAIVLDSEAMHNAYSEKINDYVIHFHVSEAPEAQTPVVE